MSKAIAPLTGVSKPYAVVLNFCTRQHREMWDGVFPSTCPYSVGDCNDCDSGKMDCTICNRYRR